MSSSVTKVFAAAALSALVPVAAHAQTVKTQISLGTQFAQGIVANPITNQIYSVASSGTTISDTLTIIDGNTDAVTANITVPVGAYLPAANILTNRVYIATCNYYETPSPCSVTVVDGFRKAVVASIPLTNTLGNGLTGVAVDPITFNVYVANGNDNVIDIINGITNQFVGSISLAGLSPQGIAFNPIDRLLYVTFGGSQLAIVDPKKKVTVGTSTVGTTTFNVATNWLTGNVFVTDTQYDAPEANILKADGSLLAQVATDRSPYGVDVDQLTNLAFVANTAFDTVTAIDGRTSTATAASPIYNVPAQFVSVNSATHKVYVAGESTVSVLTEK